MSFSIEGWQVLAQRGLPSIVESYRANASLAEEYGQLSSDEGDFCFMAVANDLEWPSLVVVQRYAPCQGGFDPGIALVPSTRTAFLGAGTRLLAYRLDDPPIRLWEDSAEFGFWHWSVHPDAVLMAAELEFAAWTPAGQKLWSLIVEPPWQYSVDHHRVILDVMGNRSEFPLVRGP